MFPGIPVKEAIIGIAITAIVVYVIHCEYEKTTAAKFLGGVQALAAQAEIDKSEAIKEGIANKEKVDAENTYLRTRLLSLSGELRDARSRGSILPAAGPSSGSPQRITFDRTELERALQRLDEGVSRLLREGDEAVIDLRSAQEWARGR